MLPAVPRSGLSLHGVCVLVERTVARWFRLGWLGQAIQLAPRFDGNRSSRAVWLR